MANHGYGAIEYEDFFTDSDGQRWFVIRSSDSNGYATVRAYPATEDGEGYVPGAPDETCYLLVRRPGDGDDAAEPQQLEFTKEFELPTGVEGDRYALTTLYQTTDGDNWINNDNWLTDAPMGQWYGVTTGADGRVTELSLIANGLAGGITPHLSLLTHLENLNLEENELVGWIPPQLGNLINLKEIWLGKNQLTGELPSELAQLSNLEVLDVWRNNLTGSLPPWLEQLTNLQSLNLAFNPITGEIPPGWAIFPISASWGSQPCN